MLLGIISSQLCGILLLGLCDFAMMAFHENGQFGEQQS